MTESLDVMGYSEDRFIEMKDDRIKVNKLVLPSMRRCPINTANSWNPKVSGLNTKTIGWIRDVAGLKWVRDRAVRNVPSQGEDYSSRVLISREDAGRRRISNREEIAAELSKLGFKTYVPGKMSYSEQVRLFSQAEFVIGTHGAGMANIIYTSNASVIEVYGNHYLPANYEFSQILDLPYSCLKCETVNNMNDIHVRVEDLMQVIEKMLDQE
jgi:hypothetical protein